MSAPHARVVAGIAGALLLVPVAVIAYGRLDRTLPAPITAVVVTGDTALAVSYRAGDPACLTPSGVRVLREDDRAVTLQASVRQQGHWRTQECAAVQLITTAHVRLSRPLAGRHIVDAATGRDVDLSGSRVGR